MSGNGGALRFDAFRLDVVERSLRRAGVPVPVTAKVFDVLAYLAANPGRLVSRAELMSAVWPDVVVEDVTLARTVSDLRKALRAAGAETQFLETVPKFGYRFTAEVTRGVEEPAKVDVPSRIGLRAGFVGLVLLMLAALMIGRNFLPARGPEVHSIAVLPLETLGGARDEVFELGIADTLISRLSQLPGLEVRSIDAVRRYAGTEADPKKVGEALRVDAVLEGTMHESEGMRRINLRLVSTKDGKSHWSQSFDEKAGELFPLEDAISTAAASALALKLSSADSRKLAEKPTRDEEAFRLYLEGRYYLARRDGPGFDKAIALFEGALARDANFAEAHVGLADAWMIRYDPKWPGGRDRTIENVRAHARRAAELKPSLGAPYRVLALVAENYDYDRKLTEQMYRKAIEVEPNEATSHHFYGEFLGLTGRFQEAEREMQIAYRLDPVSLILQTDWARVAYWARQWDVAEQRLNKVLEADPRFYRALIQLFLTRLMRRDIAGARETLKSIEADHGSNPLPSAMLAAVERDAKELDRDLTLILAQPGRNNPMGAPLALAMGGRKMESLKLLRQVMARREDAGVIGLEVEPMWDNLRGEPEFQAMLTAMGVSEPGTSNPR